MLTIGRKKSPTVCVLLIIMIMILSNSLLNIVHANEVENAKLSSNTSTYTSGDKSEEDVVLVQGKGNSNVFSNVERIENFTSVKYIPNANYFLINPKHSYNTTIDNPKGVCTTVAMQMLLGYHNYYSDRRIIPQSANGKDLLASDYGDLNYNPLIKVESVGGQGSQQIGTLDTVYEGIYDNNIFADISYVGQFLDVVKNGLNNFLEDITETTVRNEIDISNMQSFNESQARAEIDAGRPIMLATFVLQDNFFHVVVAYGYAKLNGVDGFLVHYGWGADGIQVWVPSELFGFQMRMSVNHTHSLVDTGTNFNSGYRKLSCSVCGYSTVDCLYNISNSTITSAKYPLLSSTIIPGYINKYSETTASFSEIAITALGTSAFANQTQLTSVSLPTTVTSIGESAFSGCTNLTSINLGGAQTIGNYAFQNCTSLTTISELSGVVYIGELAFLNCSALMSITIPSTVSNIGAGAFAGCNNLVITSNSSNFVAEGNILYNSNKTKIITTGNIVSNIIIEDTVTEICKYAFFNNTNLTDIEINNFIYIRGYAFANCLNLNTVSINSTIVPSLEPGAFNNTYFSLYVPTDYVEDYYEAFSGYASNVPIYEKEYEITLICSLTGQPVGIADAYYLCGVSLVYIPSKEHYEMEGLYDMPNGQGNKYLSITYNETTKKLQSEATANGWQQHSNGILYVNWTRISSAISCNAVANNSIISKPTVQITSGVASTITAPSISGYTFSSWDVAGASYTTASITITVTLHRSYNTGNITLVGTEHPTQDAYITIYYTEAPAEECVAEGTLITLADGRQVPVEQLTGNERLLVWNLKTGRFDSAPILFIDSEEAKVYDIINLYFSDGTHVKVISEHAFWDFDLNKYVYLREDASKYIGHYFNKQVTDKHGKMVWEKVQLTDVSITKEYTTAWSPVTEKHLCLYVNGMLSMPGGTEGLANTFEVNGRTMKIDRAKYRKDIKTYGVYTYEEFYELYPVPQEMFEAVDGQYLKVAIGKGLLTHEELTYLIERYSKFFE